MVYDIIPDRWWPQAGKCVRRGIAYKDDGTLILASGVEYFLTFKLPWKRKLYAINLDEEIVGHPRFVLRFLPGWTINKCR